MKRRERPSGSVPRWVAEPALGDWVEPEECADGMEPYRFLCRFNEALTRWCSPRRLDWREFSNYPVPDADPTVEPPPASLRDEVFTALEDSAWGRRLWTSRL